MDSIGTRRVMASEVDCYEDKLASLILPADKPYEYAIANLTLIFATSVIISVCTLNVALHCQHCTASLPRMIDHMGLKSI
jgi:hypothetical protein